MRLHEKTVLSAFLLSRTRKLCSSRLLVLPFACEHSIDYHVMNAPIQPRNLAYGPFQCKAQSLWFCPAPQIFGCRMNVYFVESVFLECVCEERLGSPRNYSPPLHVLVKPIPNFRLALLPAHSGIVDCSYQLPMIPQICWESYSLGKLVHACLHKCFRRLKGWLRSAHGIHTRTWSIFVQSKRNTRPHSVTRSDATRSHHLPEYTMGTYSYDLLLHSVLSLTHC